MKKSDNLVDNWDKNIRIGFISNISELVKPNIEDKLGDEKNIKILFSAKKSYVRYIHFQWFNKVGWNFWKNKASGWKKYGFLNLVNPEEEYWDLFLFFNPNFD